VEAVLVVEDEQALRELASSVLESAGYTVLVARDGREALERLEQHPGRVDLVFTDVVLPGMSGRRLAEEITLSHPGMRILFTSGYADDEGLRHGVRDSRDHFLGKPYTVSQLEARVREVLDAPP
jgi:CheY-like chemotaxis protein